MKYLILLLILSCQKENLKELDKNSISHKVQTFQISEQPPSGEFDALIAFWWPSEIQRSEQPLVEKIIKRSREISKEKKMIIRKRKNLDSRFKSLNCLCHLEEICSDGVPQEELIEQCLNISDEIDELSYYEPTLAYFEIKEYLEDFQTQEKLWIPNFLETNSDQVPFIDVSENKIFIPHWSQEGNHLKSSININEINFQEPILSFKYQNKNALIVFSIGFQLLDGVWYGTGEIQEFKNDKLNRDGVIYLEITQ